MSTTFSIVTPCLDQGRYLPGCIESVARQKHPVLEHLVFDPGSTDNSRQVAADAPSVELIAEADAGQADAVRQGFARSAGDVIGWLNADDRYVDDEVLGAVAKRFAHADRPDVVYGRGFYEDPAGTRLGDAFIFDKPAELADSLVHGVGLLQPAVFLHRRVLQGFDGPDPALRFAMDYDLWVRLALSGATFAFLDQPLAVALVHDEAKTQAMRGESLAEAIAVAQRHFGYVSWHWCGLQAAWEITGDTGILTSAATDPAVQQRTAQLFVSHNRDGSTLRKLLTPPFNRNKATTLVRLAKASLRTRS